MANTRWIIVRDAIDADITEGGSNLGTACPLGIAVGETVIRSTFFDHRRFGVDHFRIELPSGTAFSRLCRAAPQFGSVTETYRSYGIEEYVRAETTVYTRWALAEEARMRRSIPMGRS